MSQRGDPTGGRRPLQEDDGAPSSSHFEGGQGSRHGHRASPQHMQMAAHLPMPGDPSRPSPLMEMPMGRGVTQPSPFHGAPPGVGSLPSARHQQGARGLEATAVTPESGQLGMAGLMSPPASVRKRRAQLTPGSRQAAMTISASRRTGTDFRFRDFLSIFLFIKLFPLKMRL